MQPVGGISLIVNFAILIISVIYEAIKCIALWLKRSKKNQILAIILILSLGVLVMLSPHYF